MSTATKLTPGSVQRDTRGEPPSKTLVPEPLLPDHLRQQEIARLAFSLWQKRGCPAGSADEDWYQAENLLRGLQAS